MVHAGIGGRCCQQVQQTTETAIYSVLLQQKRCWTMATSRDWSRQEVETIVGDYLDMLGAELSGESQMLRRCRSD